MSPLKNSVLKGVLKEEMQRLKSLVDVYKGEIKKLPKGSISIKHIRNGDYAYLAYRNGVKICFDYLGSADSGHVRHLKEKILERKKLESLMGQASKNLREVRRMLRVRQS
jgi:hypothetical protein